jgi:hypothetical protein
MRQGLLIETEAGYQGFIPTAAYPPPVTEKE